MSFISILLFSRHDSCIDDDRSEDKGLGLNRAGNDQWIGFYTADLSAIYGFCRIDIRESNVKGVAMLDTNQEIIIGQLIRQEVLLSELYKIYSAKFPSHADLWLEMSGDEQDHAKWIKGFLGSIRKNLMTFNEGKLTNGFLETYIQGIETAIHRARNDDFSLKSAFTYAIDFETSLVEKDIFSCFSSRSGRASELLKLIQRMTVIHMNKLINEKERLNGGR